jgi:hypothetical protein
MTFIRAFVAAFAVATVLLLPRVGRTVDLAPDNTRVVPQGRLAADVAVQDVRIAGDTVSGVVVNRSSHPVRDVRLVVSHNWLWDNEMRPGEDQYSRADHYTVPGEIPPGGQVPFTARPSAPLAEGSGGHFMTQVQVTSVVMIKPGAAPTAGTRAVEPSPRGEGGGTRAVVPEPRRPDDEGTTAPSQRRLEDEDLGD